MDYSWAVSIPIDFYSFNKSVLPSKSLVVLKPCQHDAKSKEFESWYQKSENGKAGLQALLGGRIRGLFLSSAWTKLPCLHDGDLCPS